MLMPRLNEFKSKEEYNAWFRAYRAKRREQFRKYNREYNRKWRAANGSGDYSAGWIKRNPEKLAAHKAVRGALSHGELAIGPCDQCGMTAAIVAHHFDYTKPLEVVWLCRIHHRQLHYGST
jgi:hypothetical protein